VIYGKGSSVTEGVREIIWTVVGFAAVAAAFPWFLRLCQLYLEYFNWVVG
jgi:hypothetical protein